MDEFGELTKNAPKFEQMGKGELVAYAYGLFAAGNKAEDENDKLRELVRDMVDYGEGAGSGMAEFFADRMRELGVEVE